MDIKKEYIAHEIPEKETFPKYEVSTEEFKYVEKLLPPITIPKPPVHASYPTPSGWVPPDSKYFLSLNLVQQLVEHSPTLTWSHVADVGDYCVKAILCKNYNFLSTVDST